MSKKTSDGGVAKDVIGVELLRQVKGRMAQVARGLGLTRQAVVMWPEVPDKYIVAVEGITGIPREQLRPSLYRAADVAAVRVAPVVTRRPDRVTKKRSAGNNYNGL